MMTEERQYKHIKDIFPTSTEASSRGLGTARSSKAKAGQTVRPSTGDVFYKRPESENGGPGAITSGTNSVRVPSSRRKGPAPRPPQPADRVTAGRGEEDNTTNTMVTTAISDNGTTKDVAHTTSSPAWSSLSRQPGEEARSAPSDQQLSDMSDRVTSYNGDVPQQDYNSTTVAVNVVNVLNNGVPRDTGGYTNGDSSGPPTTPSQVIDSFVDPGIRDPSSDLEMATSLLSESGTTSNSSGYHSEGVLDRSRSPTSVGPGGVVSMARVPSPTPDEYQDEEGFTLDFEEEAEESGDGQVSGRRTVLYREYQGEDFAHYLQDDQDQARDKAPPAPKARYRKNRGLSSTASQGDPLENNGTLDKARKKGLKERMSQVFTQTSKSGQKGKSQNSNIQTFSFADSKIGVILDSPTSPQDSTTGSSPQSAQDFQDAGLPRSWWNAETLSARSLRSKQNGAGKSRRSNSVPDMLDTDDDPYYSTIQARDGGGERRQSRSRNSHHYDTQTSVNSTLKRTLWAKFKRTLTRKDGAATRDSLNNGAYTGHGGARDSGRHGDVAL